MQCLILAAGEGDRMGRLCDSKPLLHVAGLPLIERSIATMQQAGISEFYVVTGHAADEVESFLRGLSQRRSVRITAIRNPDWRLGNGSSLVSARESLNGPFVLTMADHLFDEAIVKLLMQEPLDDDVVVLAVDHDTTEVGLADCEDATKVLTTDHRVIHIGKEIDPYNAYDTGIFLCTPAIFDAAEESARQGDHSVSGAIRQLVSDGRATVMDIGGRFWMDVDTQADAEHAKAALFGQLTKAADGLISRKINRRLSSRLTTPLLLRAWPQITPNQVSVLSFLVAVLASVSFVVSLPVIGGVLIQLASVLDGSDGEIARLKKLQSAFGDFFDAVLDRYADILVLFGMSYYALTTTRIEPLLGFDPTGLVLGISAIALASMMLVTYTSTKSVVNFGYRYGGRLTAAGRGRDLLLFILTIGGIGTLIHPVTVFISLASVATLTTGILIWRLRTSWGIACQANPLLGMRLEAVIFDFDGTLADTMPFLTDLAVDLISANYGMARAEAVARYQATTGLDFASQMELLFPNHPGNPDVVATMEARKGQGIFSHELFAEVIPVLRDFTAGKVRCFICSSTKEGIVRDYVRRAGIEEMLDGTSGYRTDVPKGRQIAFTLDQYGLDPSEVLFVGDSLADAQFAQENDVGFVGITRLLGREAFREQGLFSVETLTELSHLWKSSKGVIQFVKASETPTRSRPIA
jgi:CDP-L-myo-inositol myo-inositolphosphotransferase